MKNWLKQNKSLCIKLGIILAIAITAFVLVTIYQKPMGFWIKEVYEKNIEKEWIFWMVVVVAQIVQAVFLQVSNSLITAPLAVVISLCYPDSVWGVDTDIGLKAFLFSWLGITIGNLILYTIGRCAGNKILKFFLGDEKKIQKVRGFVRSKEFIIIASLNPVLPSDIVNTLSGDAHVSPLFMIPETILSRGICCLTTFCLFYGMFSQYVWKIAILIPLLILMLVWSVFATKRALKGTKQ